MEWQMLRITLMTIFTILFLGCEMEPKDNGIPDGVDEKGINYIDEWLPESLRDNKDFLLKSEEDRDEFTNLVKTGFIAQRPDEQEYWELNAYKFLGLDKYTARFFEEYNLIIISKRESSISIGHKVEKITINDNILSIRIARILPGKGVDYLAMEGTICILIPVRKNYFNGENIEIEFRNTLGKPAKWYWLYK